MFSMRVGFILKPEKAEAGRLVSELAPWLRDHGHEALVLSDNHVAPAGAEIVPEDELAGRIDIAVVLGGDGTMLRANSIVGDAGIPVLGINLGRLGFLTPFDPAQAQDALEQAIAGTLPRSNRMRLQVTYTPGRGDPVSRTALNDVVINQGAMARLIELEAFLDDDLITAYRLDGLIVATPTGSTAYNLAAGGPIVFPGHAAMTITPICAHALTHRPLVVPHDRRIGIRLSHESTGVVLTIDGQWAHTFQTGDHLELSTAEVPLTIFTSDTGYFDILREKLHWGARSDR